MKMKAKVTYNTVEIDGVIYNTPLNEREGAILPANWEYHFDSDEGARCFKFKGKRRWVDNDILNQSDVIIEF